MTLVRGAAGLAAIVTAMLVQATLVGPLLYPVPVSLPLIMVVGVGVLAGPSTGIALGFGAGLLGDLTSNHPVGVLALTWLGAGVVAGLVGGVVMAPGQPTASGRARSSQRRPAWASRRRQRTTTPSRTSRWRAQALLSGLIAVGATGVSQILTAALAHDVRALPAELLLLIPTALIDAMLAVAVLVLVRAMLASPALRPATPVRLGGDGPVVRLPMDVSTKFPLDVSTKLPVDVSTGTG